MVKSKKCSGCKNELLLTKFYKNKSTLDGHSIYCKECTRINSKKYFSKKKQKTKSEKDLNMILLNHDIFSPQKTDSLLKIMMIEKMCNSMLIELSNLKNEFLQKDSNIIE